MNLTNEDVLARKLIRSLLSGESASGYIQEADLGKWFESVNSLNDAYAIGGTDLVQKTFAALSRQNKSLMVLISQDENTSSGRSDYLELSETLQSIISQETNCSQWLDEFIVFASEAAPMTPASFHQAAGLFAVSLAIARRLTASFGVGQTFPNLLMLEIAEPAIYKKSTGLSVLQRLIDAASLSHLMLPHGTTPQALSIEMGNKIQQDTEIPTGDEREAWLIERAFAAQRGWIIDEASSLFASFNQKFNSGLDMLVIKLSNCETPITGATVGRGRTTIERAYLTFFGATTPETIREHINSMYLWGTGLWSRFAFITPNTPPVYRERPAKMQIPSNLVIGLREIYELFTMPRANLVEDNKKFIVQITAIPAISEARFEDGALSILKAYSKEVGFDMLQTGAIDPTLFAAYDRLGEQAIKVSMILATMDCMQLPVIIQECHAIRACTIVESWRLALHQIWTKEATTHEIRLTDRIVQYLKRKPYGATTRELCQMLHVKSDEVRQSIELLISSDKIEEVPAGRTKVWRITGK
jgi:hypothetical protein